MELSVGTLTESLWILAVVLVTRFSLSFVLTSVLLFFGGGRRSILHGRMTALNSISEGQKIELHSPVSITAQGSREAPSNRSILESEKDRESGSSNDSDMETVC